MEANALELAESDEGFLRVSETPQLGVDASGPDATMELQINIGKPVEVVIELRARPLSTRAILSGHHRFGMVYLA
jgi:hypothetical protein